jgi:hypothetical protein
LDGGPVIEEKARPPNSAPKLRSDLAVWQLLTL